MADKSRCQKQTHYLVVDSEAEVAEEAVDLEGEEVAAMARGIKVEEVSSSSYSCTHTVHLKDEPTTKIAVVIN